MAAKTSRSLVACPFCADREASMGIRLDGLSLCTCSSCNEEFTPRQARDKAAKLLAEWERVVHHADSAGEATG